MTAGLAARPASTGGFVVAIDNGSQSTKVLIVDAEGVVHARSRVPLKPYSSPGDGRWEHPGDDLWESIVAAVGLALADFSGDRDDLVAVGLCTIRFCRAVLREDGTLAQPVISWMDERLPRPYIRERDDARFVTTSSGYLAHRLTGVRSDASGNVQGMWPIDLATWSWSDEASEVARTGLHRDMLFDLVEPGGVLGRVTLEAAAATGLPAGIPVIATSNDKAVEALGAGLRDESDALLSLGTYVATMTPGRGPLEDPDAVWVNFAAEPGRYLYESRGVRRGMWTVSWFRDLVSSEGRRVSEAELEVAAALAPPGSGGLIAALDWLAPTDEPWRRGALVGFDGTQGRGHIHRAILEALAIETNAHDVAARRELGRDLRSLIVTGGGSRSALMQRILAAVYRVPVRVPEEGDAAGMGAAVCAAVGVGLHPDWTAAVTAMVRLRPAVDPDPELVDAYESVAGEHARVLPRVRRLFADG